MITWGINDKRSGKPAPLAALLLCPVSRLLCRLLESFALSC